MVGLFLFYVDSRQKGCIVSGMNEEGERSECALWFLLKLRQKIGLTSCDSVGFANHIIMKEFLKAVTRVKMKFLHS